MHYVAARAALTTHEILRAPPLLLRGARLRRTSHRPRVQATTPSGPSLSGTGHGGRDALAPRPRLILATSRQSLTPLVVAGVQSHSAIVSVTNASGSVSSDTGTATP
eukprot:scaffold19922_cov120-Isochrysis_galbana.AAC.2